MKESSIQGFTLIELSIVLVIIGLIIGGVLTGQQLIRVAEQRNDIATLEKLSTSVNTFRNKYNCIPGDCANATLFFSGANNGNGNQVLDSNFWFPSDIAGFNANNSETPEFYNHLARAGLIALAPFDRTSGAVIEAEGAWIKLKPDTGIFPVGVNGVNYYRIGGRQQWPGSGSTSMALNKVG